MDWIYGRSGPAVDYVFDWLAEFAAWCESVHVACMCEESEDIKHRGEREACLASWKQGNRCWTVHDLIESCKDFDSSDSIGSLGDWRGHFGVIEHTLGLIAEKFQHPELDTWRAGAEARSRYSEADLTALMERRTSL